MVCAAAAFEDKKKKKNHGQKLKCSSQYKSYPAGRLQAITNYSNIYMN